MFPNLLALLPQNYSRFALFSLHCLKWLLATFVILIAFIFQDSVQKLNMDMYIYIHIYAYAYLSTYIYIYIYTHTYLSLSLSLSRPLCSLPFDLAALSYMHAQCMYMTYQLPKFCIIFDVPRDLITKFELLETKTLN